MDYRGWWNDGRSARRLRVRVRLLGRRLAVSDADSDRVFAELSLEHLKLAEEVYADQPVRLKHDDWPDARLTVDDHALMVRLIAAQPSLARRYQAGRGTLHRLVVWGGALAATLAALLGIVQFGAEPLAAMMPLAWEESLGERTMADFIRHYGTCSAGPGTAHVQALADGLAESTGSNYRFRVHVLDGEEVNAFALPGGYIGIFRGLVREADGPNELAGVLAHEIAHAVERHPVEQLLRRSGFSILASLVTGDLSGFAVLAGDAAAFVASMANSRADETQADRLAMRLLNAASIDSNGLPRFFEKLESTGAAMPGVLTLVSTHPAGEARLSQTRALARAGRDALTAEQWLDVQNACSV